MNLEQRIEEFSLEGKDFVFLDLSDFQTNDEFKKFAKTANECIAKYSKNSVLTITNIKDVKFDTETKSVIATYMENNKPYVKFGAVIGFDGIKKIMVNAILKLSGRKNITFASNKEQAIEFLLKK